MFQQRKQFPINFWSKFQHNVLFRKAVRNYYDGCLDVQTSPSYVRYHTKSKIILDKNKEEKKMWGKWWVI